MYPLVIYPLALSDNTSSLYNSWKVSQFHLCSSNCSSPARINPKDANELLNQGGSSGQRAPESNGESWEKRV